MSAKTVEGLLRKIYTVNADWQELQFTTMFQIQRCSQEITLGGFPKDMDTEYGSLLTFLWQLFILGWVVLNP